PGGLLLGAFLELLELAAELLVEEVAQRRATRRTLALALDGADGARGRTRADVAHRRGQAAIHRVDIRDLALDDVAGAQLLALLLDDLARRDEGLDAVTDADERTVVGDAEDGRLGDRSRRKLAEERGPRIVV